MGLIFNSNNSNNRNFSEWTTKRYKSNPPCRKRISYQEKAQASTRHRHRRQIKKLTLQNIQFLKSLGLKVIAVRGGKLHV